MPAARTITCPKCATRLRVPSLQAVSESDVCPECGEHLKSEAWRQTEAAEPVHPALMEHKPGRRPVPAVIAAVVTVIVGLAVALSLLFLPAERPATDLATVTAPSDTGTAPSDTGTAPSDTGRLTSPAVIKASPPHPAEPRSDDVRRTQVPASAPAIDQKPNSASTSTHSTGPDNAFQLPGHKEVEPAAAVITTAEGTLTPGESRIVRQVTSETAVPPAAGQTTNTPDPPVAEPPAPQPPTRKPPTLAERLDVSIAAFTAMPAVSMQSLVETVEIMADVSIDFSPAVSADVVSRPVALALRDTTPRKILSAAAKRAGLVVSVGVDRILLQPATE